MALYLVGVRLSDLIVFWVSALDGACRSEHDLLIYPTLASLLLDALFNQLIDVPPLQLVLMMVLWPQ